MKHFRRSTKNAQDRADQKAISIPTKDAIAILPPKKVIKALYDYQVSNPHQNPGYLSFSQGDFLHVVGRENDPDWYEACNPLHGVRGLVPVNHFELVGKTARGSTGFETGPPSLQQAHDSGYAEKNESRSSVNGAQASRMSRTARSAPVYGIVQYDFKAERPDELEAKAGEAIIVIAQSNPEWFVAKPITRLGGPGLIPVAFIEIRDMTTGQAVENSADAIARAGVPKVEEWKKMAADYKNSSIPLGKFDSGGTNGLQKNMERMSMNSTRSQGENRGFADGRSSHTQSAYQQSRQSQLISPIRARVPKYRHQNDEFWFVVEVVMEDGRAWELARNYKDFYGLQLSLIEQFPEAAGKVEGYKRTLPFMPGPLPWITEHLTNERRGHLDHYLINLLKIDKRITSCQVVCQFFAPREGDGEIDPESLDLDTNRLSAGSQQSSNHYNDSRQSSTGNLSLQGQGGGGGTHASPQKQTPPSHFSQHSSQASRQVSQPTQLRNASGLGVPNGYPPPMLRNNSAMTQASVASHNTLFSSNASMHSNHSLSQSQSHPQSAAVKIKVWFGDSNCVVLRLPANFTFAELSAKLRDRWSLENNMSREDVMDLRFEIEYKDEATANYYRITDDDELQIARDRNEKLTLRVGAVQEV